MNRTTLLLLALVTSAIGLAACGQQIGNQSIQTNQEDGNAVMKVLYFHGKQRCATCRALEENTIELLNMEYAQAQQDGKLRFEVIDFSEPEGEAVADSYKVAWSSLILDKDGMTIDLTDMGFRYAIANPETFKDNLRTKLDELLN